MEHNYKKRDYLLAKGCKDLIDVLKPKVPTAHARLSALNPLPPIIGEMRVGEQMTVCDLARLLKRKPFQIIAGLMGFGVYASANDKIVFEIISQVVRRYGYIAKNST